MAGRTLKRRPGDKTGFHGRSSAKSAGHEEKGQGRVSFLAASSSSASYVDAAPVRQSGTGQGEVAQGYEDKAGGRRGGEGTRQQGLLLAALMLPKAPACPP